MITLENVNKKNNLYSACFLSDNDNIFILSSNNLQVIYGDKTKNDILDPIKVFDLKGNIVKEINNSREDTLFIDIYYDELIQNIYIITANMKFCKSYIYKKNEVYHKYYDNEFAEHRYIFINKIKGIKQLINCAYDKQIRIWNFHSGTIIKKININLINMRSLFLYKENYFLIKWGYNTIEVIDLEKEEIIDSLRGHQREVICIKRINHPLYGECLITQGYKEKIKLWIKDKN